MMGFLKGAPVAAGAVLAATESEDAEATPLRFITQGDDVAGAVYKRLMRAQQAGLTPGSAMKQTMHDDSVTTYNKMIKEALKRDGQKAGPWYKQQIKEAIGPIAKDPRFNKSKYAQDAIREWTLSRLSRGPDYREKGFLDPKLFPTLAAGGAAGTAALAGMSEAEAAKYKKLITEVSDIVGDFGIESLPGAPNTPNIPGLGPVRIGKNPDAIEASERYASQAGLDLVHLDEYQKVDPDRAVKIADEYDSMIHNPQDSLTNAAYAKMIQETADQYETMLEQGITPYFIRGDDPYAQSPYLSLIDLIENKRLGVFPTRDGFGTDEAFDPANNPLLAPSGHKIDGEEATMNDLFRAVHDFYGHSKSGVGFRAAGEENAYQTHAGMYSPEARAALASETRGQNSWLNYGPHGETNQTASIDNTVFADQKTGLMSPYAINSGVKTLAKAMPAIASVGAASGAMADARAELDATGGPEMAADLAADYYEDENSLVDERGPMDAIWDVISGASWLSNPAFRSVAGSLLNNEMERSERPAKVVYGTGQGVYDVSEGGSFTEGFNKVFDRPLEETIDEWGMKSPALGGAASAGLFVMPY